METGVRGYVIAGNPVFLDPFREARANVDNHIIKVTRLTEDNPAQQANIALLSEGGFSIKGLHGKNSLS
ncbi:MAG: CHASE3 domain-containing protein [Bacteroidota bacterium]